MAKRSTASAPSKTEDLMIFLGGAVLGAIAGVMYVNQQNTATNALAASNTAANAGTAATGTSGIPYRRY
jgi:hypothetical protein